MGLREACGIFGILGHPRAALMTYYGLFALQHRGEESAGIVVTDGRRVNYHKGMGLVADVFPHDVLAALDGYSNAIGHTRYSTSGASTVLNAQPIVVRYRLGCISVGHNGTLTNSKALRDELESSGSIFQSTIDSEVIVHLLAQPSDLPFREHLARSLGRLEGAFSLAILTEDTLIGVRDPNGFRPLALGKLGDSWCLASESCAFDLVGARYVRDLEPGEIVFIDAQGLSSVHLPPATACSSCIFEYVYFARPDSTVFGQNVHEVRVRIGRALAREHPVKADIVVAVPDSGNSAAIGFSRESGITLEVGFIRNHYVGRTFIKPTQGERTEVAGIKLNVVKEVVRGRRVVVVDDSIVRGTTAPERVRILRQAGAAEVHLRISCPPIRHPCYYGIDFPTREELIANKVHGLDALTRAVGADTLGYLSLEGLVAAVQGTGQVRGHCTACYSGCYPVTVPEEAGKFVHER